MIYLIGAKDGDVRKIQERLKALDHYKGQIDGIFGKLTQAGVQAFQRDMQLNVDGVVGKLTWAKLFPVEKPAHPELFVPSSRDEVKHLFGDPLTPGYWSAYGGFCETPPELNHVFKYEWQGKNGFWCNNLLVPVFQRIYAKIAEQGLAPSLYSFDGCYNVRYIRGTERLSMHSWAIAVDHNAKTNWIGNEGDMDPKVVEIFEAEKFTWGGRFSRKDPMHFEYTKAGL